jgi:hypothetical protein
MIDLIQWLFHRLQQSTLMSTQYAIANEHYELIIDCNI